MKIKKTFLFLLFLIFLSSLFVLNAKSVFAQQTRERLLEIVYPEFPGFYRPETVEFPVPDYVKYIYNFAILTGGLLALGILVFAGFGYLTSAGSPEKIKEAKDRIAGALLGLVILFGSYLLLESINPQLTFFHLRALPPIISKLEPGVLLCKKDVWVYGAWRMTKEFQTASAEKQEKITAELDTIFKDISENCYQVREQQNIKEGFNNKEAWIYFIPGELTGYGAILYEKRGYKERSFPFYKHLRGEKVRLEEIFAQEWEIEFWKEELGQDWIYLPKKEPIGWRIGALVDFNPSSIMPFMTQFKANPDWEVVLYEKTKFNEGFPEPYVMRVSYKLDDTDPLGKLWWKEVKPIFPENPKISPQSIKIEGDLLAILFREGKEESFYSFGTRDVITVGLSDTFFAEKDSNLNDNLNIVKWERCKSYEEEPQIIWKGAGWCARAGADSLVIFNAVPY